MKFEDILTKMNEIYRSKNSDYGNSFDETCDKFGPIAGVVRITDKYNRIVQLLTKKSQQKVNESVQDTLLDMANYCILLMLWLNKNKDYVETK